MSALRVKADKWAANDGQHTFNVSTDTKPPHLLLTHFTYANVM